MGQEVKSSRQTALYGLMPDQLGARDNGRGGILPVTSH